MSPTHARQQEPDLDWVAQAQRQTPQTSSFRKPIEVIGDLLLQ